MCTAARNALEETTIQSIRKLEHRDADGNVISETRHLRNQRMLLMPGQLIRIDPILLVLVLSDL